MSTLLSCPTASVLKNADAIGCLFASVLEYADAIGCLLASVLAYADAIGSLLASVVGYADAIGSDQERQLYKMSSLFIIRKKNVFSVFYISLYKPISLY